MTNLIAIAPKYGEISRYLTNGKEYMVLEVCENRWEGSFLIRDDKGKLIHIRPNNCAHINRLNWTIRRMTIFERIKYFFV